MKAPLRRLTTVVLVAAALGSVSAQPAAPAAARFRLLTLDPGHFHASLVQKFMYADVDPLVRVYAPAGDDVTQHLARVERFNTRTDSPTRWRAQVYTGPDFLDKMIAEKAGNVVVISGNNARKTDSIVRAIDAGLNVLADKPMARTPADLVRLKEAFATAAAKKVLLYDIMSERSEITTVLQRELSRQPALFGELLPGTPLDPAITKESVHHFSKIIAGAPLKRPQWFFDVRQEGEGIVDVMTHLVDLVQWEAFPEQTLSLADVNVIKASRSATTLTPEEFKQVTSAEDFPEFLRDDVRDRHVGTRRTKVLHVYSNGSIDYRLRGVHAHVSVKWNFEAPAGTGDTHYSIMRGTKARLVIRQGAEQKFKPVLYIEQADLAGRPQAESVVASAIAALQPKYPGIGFQQEGDVWAVTVPQKYDVGHEAHFAEVMERYLSYLRSPGTMPEWEVPNMIVKYSTIMRAYELAHAK